MLNKRLINTGVAVAPFDPLQNFETVTYTGNGGTQKITGYIRKGAAFNGSSSYISTSLNAYNIETISYSFWVYWNSSIAGCLIGGLGNDGATGSKSNRQTVSFSYSYNRFDYISRQGDYCRHTTSLSEGWHHFVVTDNNGTDSSTAVNMYIDGSEVSFSQPDTQNYSTNTQLQIGRTINNVGSIANYFNGKLDQVRIFDKALSSSEVTTLYGETYASSTKSTTDIFGDGSGVALYELDEDANDTGGTSGKFGSAAHFNGSSSKIDLPNFMPSGNASRSVSMWIKTTQTTAATLFQYGSGATSQLFNFRINDGGAGGGANTIGIGFFANDFNRPATGLMDGNWHHVAATYDGTNAKIYIDGVQTGADFATGGVNTTASTALIGSNGGSFILNGQIDQVRLYSSALSSTDVANLYAESNVPTTNLLAHYKLDGDATDEQGSYDGTASNVAWGYDGTPTNVNFLGMAFQPDLVWIKERTDSATWHGLIDSVRGTSSVIYSNETSQANTSGSAFTSFDSNGFTLSLDTTQLRANDNGDNYVAWCWKAGGTAVSNTDGTITSQVSANQAAGFSIVKWTAGSDNNATIGHGLSQAPEIVIYKILNTTGSWHFNTTAIDGSYDRLSLNTTNAKTDVSSGQEFTSTTFKQWSYSSGNQLISYCFHSVDGYQKVGSYSGLGTSAVTVTTGFEPRFLLIKRYDSTGGNWYIYDQLRDGTNDRQLYANTSDQESTTADVITYNSDGFTIAASGSGVNASSSNYIYLAIA